MTPDTLNATQQDVEQDVERDIGQGAQTDAETDAASAASALDRALEAILIIADEPQSLMHLASALGAPLPDVRAGIARLVADFDGELTSGDGVTRSVRRGFELREVAGGWRIYVRASHDELVADFVVTQNPSRLSQAALETLAVIAYKQPISRGAVASIRAVNVDSVVRTLLGRGLITEAFADSETGAVNYATTDLLLSQLGINSLDELPHISPLLTDGAEGFEDLR
ncbi:SMC-Scp complex subunit ScpB [Glaciibacter psychrotolerans]|uniref:Segregation and condensation protein B n=1 Tax=Glaciibacter psychrotolerans TaxID=670054 RepID=A0A7Z0ECG3_9MICO|nr:SMC-Scp complex subunit ScpB [Leifsonia psychrotolerans]NYJ18464.1 segregation and condensation protein B [Leifsonia psychrotolerans]